MARLPRLSIAGQLHLVIQRGHAGAVVFRSEDDYQSYLQCLRAAAVQHGVAVHAYALLPDQVLLLATPASDGALGHLLQGLGRRFGAEYNRRHGRTGALWDGRFRSTVVDAAAHLIDCLRYVESAPSLAGLAGDALDYAWSSAAHHAGRRVDPLVTEHPEFWRLGNTPFDREARFRRLLEESLPALLRRRIADAATKGWALGGADFVKAVEQQADRPASPRRRGRPAKSSRQSPAAG